MKIRLLRTAVIVLLITALFAAAFVCAEDGTVYYSSREEAAEALREALKDREHMVTIAIYERVDEESIKTIIGDMFSLALEHTGEPDEGDYIKYQFSDYKGKAETDLHWGAPVVVIRYVINYYTDAAEEKLTDKKVKEILNELDLEGQSDYKKIKAIHDYICEHVEYDVDSAGDNKGGIEHTAYAALNGGKAVCQGYCVAMYRLLLESGVDCRIMDGTGIESAGMEGAHSWNIVSIGGVYFYVDATWDDSTESLEYFLRNRDDFEKDHVISEEYGEDFVTDEYPVSLSGFAVDYDTPLKKIVKAVKALPDAFDAA